MKKGNVITAIICMILAAWIIVVCMGYPKAASYGTGVPGPGLWPGIIAGGLFLAAAALVAETVGKAKEEFGELPMWSDKTKRVYGSMIILGIYVFALAYVGFIITSAIMMYVFIRWFGNIKIWKSILISLVVTLVIYFVFKSLLNVPVDFGMFYI